MLAPEAVRVTAISIAIVAKALAFPFILYKSWEFEIIFSPLKWNFLLFLFIFKWYTVKELKINKFLLLL